MALLAAAYHGPPELTLSRAFTEWTADPVIIALVVVLGACYLAGVRRIGARGAGSGWKTGRTVAFCGLGLGFLVIATMSWTGVYQNILFYARATQTVLLVLVVPLFLAMGKPLTLLTTTLPITARSVDAVVHSRIARIVTFPAIPTLLLVAVPFSMYFTSWYTATFRSGTARELTYLALMAPGYLFFWILLRVDPVPKQYPYGVAMWITAAEVVGDAFFGIAVIADTNLLAGPYYHGVGWPYGPSLATSQVLGGGILWILGDFVGLPFLAVQLVQMMREDKAEAAAVDAELDAKEAARAARRAAREARAAWRAGETFDGTADAPDSEDPERPWWESDARFTERFKNAPRGSQPGPLRPCEPRAGSVAAADPESPARGQLVAEHELVRLHAAPGGDVGERRGVVGEDGDDLPDGHVTDLLGEHDDRDRALAAERVDGPRRGGHRGGLFRSERIRLSLRSFPAAEQAHLPIVPRTGPGRREEHVRRVSTHRGRSVAEGAGNQDPCPTSGVPDTAAGAARYCFNDTL